MSLRAFSENPEYKEIDGRVRPVYGTSDPLTMDFSDIMNFLGSTPLDQDPDKEQWDSMFNRFKSFWYLNIENPYTSPKQIDLFFREIQKQDDGETDEWTTSDIEKMWKQSML